MKSTTTLAAAAMLVFCATASARPYINDKKAPETPADLLAIQQAMQRHLPATRAATVAIELDGGSGTGVIISEDGLILTAAHVSTGVDKDLTIIMEDGTRHEAISLGVVASTDAAMVRIVGDGPFPFVEIDRKRTTRLGDWVFAVGHAGGYSIERGAVVRLGRLVRIAQSTYQTDCTLIGGDSGGPLFDLEGKLIAIHSRVGMRLPENMHVPMHEFLLHWEAMERSEFVGSGPFAQLAPKGSGLLGVVGEASDGGLKVTRIVEESAAAKAEIEVGDVILSLNEQPVENQDALRAIIAEMAADDRITLELRRASGENETLKLRLGARKP